MSEDEKEMRIIKVRNIFDSKIDEELLYELFLQAGPINSIFMPVGQNGKKTMAIIEYTYEAAVPYALFIFEGTELYGVRLCMSSCNNKPPSFYVPQDSPRDLPIPEPFNNFNARLEPPPMMMNISNSSFPPEHNFDALLQMGQNMLIPPPMGFGIPMNMPSFGMNTNDQRDYNRNDYHDHGRDRHRDSSYDRGDRDHSRTHDGGGRNKHKHRRR